MYFRILLPLLSTTLTFFTHAGFIFNPDSKNNPFFRDDSYLYIEDARQNLDKNDLNHNGKKDH